MKIYLFLILLTQKNFSTTVVEIKHDKLKKLFYLIK